MSAEYGCWATGCSHQADVSVMNASARLLRPVESCNDHLGDLLGNIAKAAIRENPRGIVSLQVQPLL